MVCKHHWIYIALSVLIATYSAHESAWFLLLLGLLVMVGLLKSLQPVQILLIIAVGFATFFLTVIQLNKIEKPLTLPTVLTWSGEYKINGAVLRGFMKDESGQNIYVTYQFQSEEEKRKFDGLSLAGKQFVVEGELVQPNRLQHAYSFDMNRYLRSKGAKGILEIQQLEYVGQTKSISHTLNHLRFQLKKHIEHTFPSSLIAEAEALLLGLQDNVDEETTRAYQKLGITHLFAISGLHVGIFAFLFYQGLLRLYVRREMATILLLIFLPMYAVLAGGAPSVWRAVIVVELVMLSRLRKGLAIDDALSICFIGFVLVEPWSIFQIGFQLSFLATASIIYSREFLQSFRSWWHQSFFVTFVCQLIVYPLLLFHFYEISISSLIVNIIFVPLFSFIILPMNILLFLFSFLPGPFSNLLFTIYEPLRLLLGEMIEFLQSIPYQMWVPGQPSVYLIIISYISIFIAFYFMDQRNDPRKLKKVLFILAIPIVLIHFEQKWNSHMQISFVDVGQGDCIVIELPYRKAVYVIDTGGVLRFGEEGWKKRKAPYEVGRQVVVPFLKGKGISKVDKLILTHADHDHVEGAEEILRDIMVKEIHVTPSSLSKPIMNDLIEEAKRLKIPIKEQMAKSNWNVGDVHFQYLWPHDTHYEGNNDSLVLLIKWRDFEALFTGDLEQEGEMEFIRKYPKLKRIDLLKAGHHGSKTSSSEPFIQTLQPTVTIFCAGENNRYGHPHEEVVERFDSKNLKTLTTGEVGTIEIIVKEEGMRIQTMVQ